MLAVVYFYNLLSFVARKIRNIITLWSSVFESERDTLKESHTTGGSLGELHYYAVLLLVVSGCSYI